MGVGAETTEVQQMAEVIGCEEATFPFVYHGVPVGGNITKVATLKNVIDIFKSRLSNWKVKTLSVGGRLTLLKSILGSIAIYFMSIFRTPITIKNTLEAITNKFFWGAEKDEKKLTLIKWKKSMASKKYGGLGIGSLYRFNRALLYKWKRRFRTTPDG